MSDTLNSRIVDPEYELERMKKLEDYTQFTVNDVNDVPLGSYIKFISRRGAVIKGGFLVKVNDNVRPELIMIFLKGYRSTVKLRPYFYKMFYKLRETFKKESKKVKRFKSILLTKTNE